MLRIRRRRFLPLTVRLNTMAALALVLCSGCAGPPGGSMIPGPLPEPPPQPEPPPEPETFAGKGALKSRIDAAGGFEGMVAIFDSEDSDHGMGMRRAMINEGVPADNIAYPELTHVTDLTQFELERNADLLARTRVAHMPFLAPISNDEEPGVIAAQNVVWSIAAGNTHGRIEGGDRDFWNRDHAFWVETRTDPGSNCCENAWENHMEAFDTGKVLIVTYAHRDGEGGYQSIEGIVSCGEARHACMAVAQPLDENDGTSGASAKLAAAAFYVFQLYEKAEEVVDTLKECAEDIGEPGVDYEFGLGVLSLACERVENAEVLTASSSLVMRWDAPALEGLLDSTSSSGMRVRASRWIADWDGLPLARLGAEYSLGALEFALSAGRVRAPLGVGSRYVRARPALYAEGGAGLRLFESPGRDVSAVFSLGRGAGALSPRTSRAGLALRESAEDWNWSAYAGYSRIRAWVGIPGHLAADRGRSLARASGWEALLTFEQRL